MVPSTAGHNAAGLFVWDTTPPAVFDFVFTRNSFEMVGSGSWGLYSRNFSGGVFKGNTFTGGGSVGASITSDGAAITNWVISETKGLNTSSVDTDVLLTGSTNDNIVGPVNGINISDQGCNFDLNQVDGGCALNGPMESQVSG